jgi:hypothetical protein
MDDDNAIGNQIEPIVDRYELVSSDKATRTAYRKWEYEQALNVMEYRLRWHEGKVEGKDEGKFEMLSSMFSTGIPEEQIWAVARANGIARERYEQFRAEVAGVMTQR